MSEDNNTGSGNEESQTGYVDIYLRFNDDMEKDYCFQIKTTTTFRDLFRIFNELPISLRPSVFYSVKPIGFKKSISPGYLTEDGNFLFDYDSQNQTVPIKDFDELINNNVWPGQLIIPEWKFNDFGFYSFVTFLICWLYTDLPDFISPTPGLCLTNQVTNLFGYLASRFGYGHIADLLLEDVSSPVSVTGQIFFFVFHLMKIGIIFGLFYSGAVNPYTIFTLGRNVQKDITKEQLLELGWTGTKKATIDEYKDYYRDYKTDEYGGMVPAHRAGLFNTMKHLGCELEQGEGYNTPLTKENMIVTFDELLEQSKQPNFKLKLCYDYFAELGLVFATNVENKQSSELPEFIKQYRRYGLLISNDKLKQIVKARKGLPEPEPELESKQEVEKVEEIVDEKKNDEDDEE
ncbi:GSF2 [[Candida] subhashii]|uniref:GSF2 n=1 Tax=[Candida] subhashii TaxID=561895 RepID=A0A8J5UXU8_9ASCO|nr:GSF2 [[Candida] subhashii]KAG7662599.1 GSF2 [[Candida] subhashii]